jgi:hypothetical protein
MTYIESIQNKSRIVGTGVLLICVVLGFFFREQFFRSYLFAYMFCLGVVLGSMVILMIYHMTGGAWGAVSRRILEAAISLIPLLAVLFLPIAGGVHSLYEWTHAEVVNVDELLKHKSAYLNLPFFYVRAAIYFAIWYLIARNLLKKSEQQDRSPDQSILAKLEFTGGFGLVLYGLTMSFASVDWMMSLDPHWFSTIYGLLVICGQTLTAFAFLIGTAAWLSRYQPYSEVIEPDQFHDLGKLMLAFVMIWAYLAVSQFLIIWSGNLPEETRWYIHRLQGGWQFWAVIIVIFHFALPFILLLSRSLKRNARTLSLVALFILLMRLMDLFWLIAPEFNRGHLKVHVLDFALPAGLVLLCFSIFLGQLKKRPMVPINDPNLPVRAHVSGEPGRA